MMTTKWRWSMLAVTIMLAGYGQAWGCTILDQQSTGSIDGGVRGFCSNNRQPIHCEYTPGDGWTCEGSEGSYSSNSLESLVVRVCGCSVQE